MDIFLETVHEIREYIYNTNLYRLIMADMKVINWTAVLFNGFKSINGFLYVAQHMIQSIFLV
jgi:hypothetical protein